MKSRFSTLRLDRVSRSFGRHAALRELSLDIAGGEFVALLGPSGCGKSTALNCLAGLLPLTGGSIRLDGERVDHIAPERRGFGMVFQNYALFPHLTVRGNVGFGLRMAKVAKAEIVRRTAEALELVQLTGHAHKRPGQLSGGQQQRVAIARAIVLEPRLVLMDEPLSNLDAALRLEMRTEIRRLHQSLGLTTVYVTHDQEEALSLADRLVVLRDGLTQQIGTPEEVYGQPANRYVASFMGYRNMLDVTVTAADGPMLALTLAGTALTGIDRGGLGPGAPGVVALRPEDLDIAAEGTAGLPVTVEVVEYHGRELAVRARLATGQGIHFRTGRRLAPGDAVELAADPRRVLVFAPDGTDGTDGTEASGEPPGAEGRAAALTDVTEPTEAVGP
ncbi:ABC transporter ATP-binding protein [Streptomyces sp. NPDC057638]|uniref:ABC transporter ATP-binding protein n=1 Tax=Streptomyces sp. NPDC057638 TaxID=3346190 RepID=UPI00369CFAB4